MQKKELRKSWRRKLAGLLAGTLIAGVFGISTPMTAQAVVSVSGAQDIVFADTINIEDSGALTATKVMTLENSGDEEANVSIALSDGADSYFTVTDTVTVQAASSGSDSLEPGRAPVTFGLNDTTIKKDLPTGLYQDTVTFSGDYNATVTISVEFVETTYGISATFGGGTNALEETLDFTPTGSETSPLQEGYTVSEAAALKQTITVTNDSNTEVLAEDFDLDQASDSIYLVSGMPTSPVPAKGSFDVTVTPKTGLAPDTYEEALTFSIKTSSSGVDADVTVNTTLTVVAKEAGWKVATPASGAALDLGKANKIEKDAGKPKYTVSPGTIEITNTGDFPINGISVSTDSDGVSVKSNKASIQTKGGTATITVTPEKDLVAGDYSGEVTISATDMEDLVVPFTFALVDADYTAKITDKEWSATDKKEVTAIDLGERGEGYTDSVTKSVYLTNVGDAEVNYTATIKNDTGKAFNLGQASGNLEVKTTPESKALSVTASPKLGAGDYTADLVIKYTETAEEVTIPLTFSVKEGTYTFDVQNVTDSKNVVALTSHDFGKKVEKGYDFNLDPKKPDTLKVAVKNTGNAPIYLAATVTATPTGKDGFETTVTDVLADYDPEGTYKASAIAVGASTNGFLEVLPETTLGPGTYTTTVKLESYDKAPSASDAVKKDEKTITFTFTVEKENIAVTVAPASYDFGPIPEGYQIGKEVEARTVTLTNSGNKSVTIAELAKWSSGSSVSDFTFSDPSLANGGTLKVGESATVKIAPVTNKKFDTGKNPKNTYDNTLKLTVTGVNEQTGSSAPAGTTKEVTLNASFSVIAAEKSLEAVKSEVTMEVPEGYKQSEAEAAEVEVSIVNTGNVELDISKYPANGAFYFVTVPTEKKVAAGETFTIKVRPRVGQAVGTKEANLAFNFNGAGKNDADVVVKLTMNVTERKTEAKVTPATLDFGTYNKMKAAPAAKTVTVENTGNGEITLTQPTATMFEIGDLDKTVIQGGEKATFTVVPKADIKAGEQKETITIKGSNGMTDLTVEATVNVIDEGWKKESDGWYYYKDGAAAKGWLKTGGKWYFLDKSTGLMKTGWLKDDGKWYYLKASGAMASNEWVKDGGKYYFFKSGGAMASAQWVSWKGDWYYMNAGGSMKTEGWTKSAGKWYYMGKDGKMVKSTSVTVKGKKYNFDKNGVCTNP